MLYELINPSDPYVLEADERIVACLACLLLGPAYGLAAERDGEGMPTFCFASADDVEAWFRKEFGMGLGEAAEKHRAAVATCLNSLLIGSFADFRNCHEALRLIPDVADRERWLLSWHDEHRSSVNDIRRTARELVQQLTRHECD